VSDGRRIVNAAAPEGLVAAKERATRRL
jgi:hypothetical protein